jgi:hypothetical protein
MAGFWHTTSRLAGFTGIFPVSADDPQGKIRGKKSS